ncbi:RidA family protein [Rhizobium sp. NFR07]|uniref:RidA family protein n=1 Tax=Rhizobium sp. NFR07 TaxID=1566262 RepID=UPI0015A5665F|nr:RidA family protein [Rhizobium sp. NFR07]
MIMGNFQMLGHRINSIEGVWSDDNFPMSQAVVEPDGRRVHLTGQVAWTKDCEIVGQGNAEKQTCAAINNIEKVLAGLGGTIADVVSTTMYYVRDNDLDAIQEVRRARFATDAGPAVTGVRVSSLVDPGLLVELTVIAVIPYDRFQVPLS